MLRISESEDPAYTREKSLQDRFSNSLSMMDEADDSDSEGSKTITNDKESLKKGEISVDQVIDKLNTIRSGRSFKDKEIKTSLDQYFQSLKKPEKVALFAFLKGIAQLVTGEIQGSKALEPADPDPSIEMKKNLYKKMIKPTIVKKSSGDKKKLTGKVGGEKEDTSAPVPIKPKG
jgi:hypothetical protein